MPFSVLVAYVLHVDIKPLSCCVSDSVHAPRACLSHVQGHKNGSSHSLNSKPGQLLTRVSGRFLPFFVTHMVVAFSN